MREQSAMSLPVTITLACSVLLLFALAFGAWHFVGKTRRLRLARQFGDLAGDYAVRRDWRKSKGKVNYSSFVYLDVDRDGVYGLSDRPMAGVLVRLSKSGRHVRRATTNINGFANFPTSVRSKRAPIRAPGTYSFEVSVPPGCVATSDNLVQAATFRLIPGSPSGICAEEMVRPVGLAPLRWVTGKLAAPQKATISATKAGESGLQETLEPGANFRFNPPEAADGILLEGQGFRRMLAIGSYPTHLGVVSQATTLLPAEARLETIEFDDLTPGYLKKIPSGYAGLNWFNLNVTSRDAIAGAIGCANGNVSGVHLCYTSSGHPAEIWNEKPFGLHSVMLSMVWPQSEGEIVCIECWNGQDLVARDEFALSAFVPTHYVPALNEVTRMRISARHFWQIALDDLAVVL
jgi:hypothetical protein